MAFSSHSEPIEKVFEYLKSQKTGLTAKEAEERMKEYGPNALPEVPVPGIIALFFSQFLSPLIYILIVAAAIMTFMGETEDGVIIFIVLLFNAVVGTFQEGKAQNTLKALRNYTKGTATIVRDGKPVILPDSSLVPGDVVMLQEGEKVPADARLILARSLRADESTLTGESLPIGKTADDIPKKTVSVAEQKNMVFKGTNIVGGMGEAVVVRTVMHTEIGEISKSIASIDADLPLKKNIAFLSRAIIIAVFAISILIFMVGIFQGQSFIRMFATVVSLVVAVIPEGLPIVMTLVLASGVWRMSKQNVLVKKLQAVEGLGQAKIIAVDKTGTLTKNEMMLERMYIGGKTYAVGGAGYEPKGSITLEGKTIVPADHPDIILLGRIAALSANAEVMYVEKEKLWRVSGDPTEAALEIFAKKAGFAVFDKEQAKIFDIPFDYATKYHLTIHAFEGKNILALVGAPETILERSKSVWSEVKSVKMGKKEREAIDAAFKEFSENGYRVLGIAANFNARKKTTDETLPPLTFLGFFGIRDPLRKEVQEAVERAKRAGIRVVMITGDHAVTAQAIAREAGIFTGGDCVITGEELDRLPEAELVARFEHCNVFARVTPTQKLKIIGVFKKRGEVVAMTGDGVNDAPPLAAADLGVAMGKVGTEVAKEAADIVLLDDNFGNIVSAVEEGRNIYKTIRKVILYLFSTNLGEVFVIVGSMALSFPLPMLPVQIIWLNFVTDGFLDIALAMEQKEGNLLTDAFVKPTKYILDGLSLKRMLLMAGLIAAGTLFIFSHYLSSGAGLEKALTVSLTTLAVFQWFNAWNCKHETRSVFTLNPLKNIFLIGATCLIIVFQLFAIYHPFMQKFLHTVPLSLAEWGMIIAVAASILVVEEVRKLFGRMMQAKTV